MATRVWPLRERYCRSPSVIYNHIFSYKNIITLVILFTNNSDSLYYFVRALSYKLAFVKIYFSFVFYLVDFF